MLLFMEKKNPNSVSCDIDESSDSGVMLKRSGW